MIFNMSQISVIKTIKDKIYQVRNLQVMIDSEIAALYGVETKVFNQAVKRNIERFPEEFRFQLTEEEFNNLKSQFVTSRSEHGGRRYLPYVFTEQGVAMLSAVLKSKTAVEISIQIMHAFVEMRKFFASHGDLVTKIQHIEQRQILHESRTQEKFEALFSALEENPIVAKQGIFFDGQVFDAYVFVSKLVRSAKKSIILIDNYIDETVLELLTKANKVKVYILTKNITKNLELDVEKYNEQYQEIRLFKFGLSHDRFLIIDQKEIYHIGASLKDLGKKWFAFSKFEQASFGLMSQVEKIINP